MPYGNRPSDEIVALTRDGVDALFRRGCRLVLLGCNTATCVAARTLQKDWLPVSGWTGRNILGIVAPTVEAATQTPWAVTTPQYPQKYNTDVVAVFGTTRTIASHAYPEEIRKRCPKVTVVQQTCAELVGAIERGAPEDELDRPGGARRDRAAGADRRARRRIAPSSAARTIRWSSTLFRRHLPPFTRLLSQPEVVADSLEDYLQRHPRFLGEAADAARFPILLTSGEPARISGVGAYILGRCAGLRSPAALERDRSRRKHWGFHPGTSNLALNSRSRAGFTLQPHVAFGVR